MAADNKSPDAAKAGECPPLFRWAGGKRRLLGQIIPLLPPKYNHYYEPFCGGAAMFFHLRPPKTTLGDKNEELINCYRQVQSRPEEVITALGELKDTKAEYYRVRAELPKNDIERAARLIYLMARSFNGLYRVNSNGEFNVPYGSKRKKKFNFERIRNVSKALTGVKLVHGEFENTVADAKAGDLVYFDPPYTVAHGNNGFVQYNEKIFSWTDQEKLATLAEALAQRGCTVVVSNAEHSSIEGIYSAFKACKVNRHSGIGGPPGTRRRISEFVFTK